MVRIPLIIMKALCLETGGSQVVITAVLISFLEIVLQEYTNDYTKRLVDYFDTIVGSGFNSIVAGLLAYRFSGADILKILKKNMPKFFCKSLNLSRSKYSTKKLHKAIRKIFNFTKYYEDTPKALIVSSSDILNKSPILFKSWKTDISYNIVDIITGSCTTPYYFDTFMFYGEINHHFNEFHIKNKVYHLVINNCNNNVQCGINCSNCDFILNVGTGVNINTPCIKRSTNSIAHLNKVPIKNYNKKTMVETCLQECKYSSDNMLTKQFNNSEYAYLNPIVISTSSTFVYDNIDKDYLKSLIEFAKSYIEDNYSKLTKTLANIIGNQTIIEFMNTDSNRSKLLQKLQSI